MTDTLRELLAVPDSRLREMRAVLDRIRAARSVVLTTHVNADADGCGSEAAVAAWLEEEGARVTIVNPTPFPASLRFLLHRPDLAAELGPGAAAEAMRAADLFLVLDTSEPNRVAALMEWLDPERTVVVDHHPAGPQVVGSTAVQDPAAAATGELVYDLVTLAGDAWTEPMVRGVYVAIVSDTGSFRFSNTSPRVHAIAAELIALGADPEAVFQQLFATFPRRRFDLLREALAGLRNEPETGLSWMWIPREVTERLGVTHEDFEGLIDQARSVEGTRVAVLFRELPSGETKISLRSNGGVDVNRIARNFSGGGHVKAAGATLSAGDPRGVEGVLDEVRRALREDS